MLNSGRMAQQSAALAFLLILAPAVYAEFGEGELFRSSAPLAIHHLVPTQEYLAIKHDEMEEIVVTAPRQQPVKKLRRSLMGLLANRPGGLDLQWLPSYDPEQGLALEEQRVRERPTSNQFEPAGGMQLFRITLDSE